MPVTLNTADPQDKGLTPTPLRGNSRPFMCGTEELMVGSGVVLEQDPEPAPGPNKNEKKRENKN